MGARGLKQTMRSVPAGFAALYRSYSSGAVVTEEVQEVPLLPGLGVSPISFISPHEWGTKGVEAPDTQA